MIGLVMTDLKVEPGPAPMKERLRCTVHANSNYTVPDNPSEMPWWHDPTSHFTKVSVHRSEAVSWLGWTEKRKSNVAALRRLQPNQEVKWVRETLSNNGSVPKAWDTKFYRGNF